MADLPPAPPAMAQFIAWLKTKPGHDQLAGRLEKDIELRSRVAGFFTLQELGGLPDPSTPPRAAEAFSGGGLFALALHIEGVHTEHHCEMWKPAVETLRHNLDPGATVCDAWSWSPTVPLGGLDILAGGPPCQPWSKAGKRRGKEDERNLWPRIIEWVDQARPRVLCMENVPGISEGTHALFFTWWWGELKKLGYEGTTWQLRAADYGTPQLRARTWFIAWPIGAIWGADLREPPPATHTDPRKAQPGDLVWTQAASRLTDGCCGGYGYYSCKFLGNLHNRCRSCLGGTNYERAQGDERDRQLSDAQLQRAVQQWYQHPGVRLEDAPETIKGRGAVGYLAGTLTKGHGKGVQLPTITEYGGVVDPGCGPDLTPALRSALRYLTPREAAKLMDVPSWYEFKGSAWQQTQQLGNGIAVNMGRAVVRHVLRALGYNVPQVGSLAAVDQGLWPLDRADMCSAYGHFTKGPRFKVLRPGGPSTDDVDPGMRGLSLLAWWAGREAARSGRYTWANAEHRVVQVPDHWEDNEEEWVAGFDSVASNERVSPEDAGDWVWPDEFEEPHLDVPPQAPIAGAHLIRHSDQWALWYIEGDAKPWALTHHDGTPAEEAPRRGRYRREAQADVVWRSWVGTSKANATRSSALREPAGDFLTGGLADELPLEGFDPEALARGTAIEREHTHDLRIAREIASDHLAEHPLYYDEDVGLPAMERVLDARAKQEAHSAARALKGLPPATERRRRIKAAALAGEHGRFWYQEAEGQIRLVARAWGVDPTYVAVAVAATSPMRKVVMSPRMARGGGAASNIGAAREVVKRQAAGMWGLFDTTSGRFVREGTKHRSEARKGKKTRSGVEWREVGPTWPAVEGAKARRAAARRNQVARDSRFEARQLPGSTALNPRTPGIGALHTYEACARNGGTPRRCLDAAYPRPQEVKTHAFVRNLLDISDDPCPVTVDTLIGRGAGIEPDAKGSIRVPPARHRAIAADVRAVAKDLGWAPRETMAAAWTAWGGSGGLDLATTAEKQMVRRSPATTEAEEPSWLDLPTIQRFVPLMAELGVSIVARGPRGFLPAFRRAGGDPDQLVDPWRRDRNNFLKRHLAQVQLRREPLWTPDGHPTRRHLALIAWAHSPEPLKAIAWATAKNRVPRVEELP